MVKTMGQKSADEFSRYYILPGVGHFSGDDGPELRDVQVERGEPCIQRPVAAALRPPANPPSKPKRKYDIIIVFPLTPCRFHRMTSKAGEWRFQVRRPSESASSESIAATHSGRSGSISSSRRSFVSTASRLAMLAFACALPVQSVAHEPESSLSATVPPNRVGAGEAAAGNVAWPQIPQPPAHAPNVLLIMTDDVGFGSSSTFGGPVPTPNLERLASQGIRYNGFNTTALCSPTRASLLTGRLPHNVNMGQINNLASPYEGYTSVIPKSAGMVAETLRENGYATAAFGKWHLTPEWEESAFGPFDRWPTREGFNYFYGFLGGDTDQFAPALYENTLPVAPPVSDPSYILDRDLADRAIGWIRKQHDNAPQHPFFVYLAPGTAHSPHQAPQEWLEKFKGKFDRGWDVIREETFSRQKLLGIIPADARLTPRPNFLPAWDSLAADRKRVYAREMEAYAAALAFDDFEMGRVIDSLKTSGQFDDTLIIFIEGDNGSSAEGGLYGLLEEQSFVNGYDEDFEYVKRHIDDIGGPRAYNHYPAAWAWAMNSPFQYYKQVASHFGGIRNGLVVSWPGHLKNSAAVRQQLLHVSDVTPTILETAGIKPPEFQNGIKQMPLDGISFAYTFSDPTAPNRRHTQVFEMAQNLGIYHDGWWAGTTPMAAPWEFAKKIGLNLSDRHWELYHISKDFSQATDLAKADPARLEEMKKLFFSEAARNNILPIHGSSVRPQNRPSLTQGRTEFTFHPGTTRVPEFAAPSIIGRSFEITADIEVPSANVNGVLVTEGGRFGGYSFYVKDGKPVFHYNMTNDMQYVIRSTEPITRGAHRLTARFQIDKPVPGSGGTLILLLDGKLIGSGRIEKTHRTWFFTETFDVGEDTLTPISDDYTIEGSKFSGRLNSLHIELK
jgi:arylsulfatase